MALVTVPDLTALVPSPGLCPPESRNPTTRFFQDADGGEWMGKDLREIELLGEAMGAWVGGRVGLNVPDGGVRDGTWYSAWQKLPQWTATGAARVAPEEVARMIVFDVVLGIPDRHPGGRRGRCPEVPLRSWGGSGGTVDHPQPGSPAVKTRYRTVQFVPSLLSGARVPIGVLLESEGGAVTAIAAPRLPSAAVVGGADRLESCRAVLEILAEVQSFTHLPNAVNALAVLGEVNTVPAADPVAWVHHVLFAEREGPSRTKHRATIGFELLAGVLKERVGAIRKTFDAQQDGPGWLRGLPLPRASHWTGSTNSVLLLEPLVLDRASWQHDVSTISTTLGAYSTAARKSGAPRSLRGAAYVGGHGPAERRREVVRQLAMFADDVYDLADEHEADRLAQAIADLDNPFVADAK
jgi:hypothetical protein